MKGGIGSVPPTMTNEPSKELRETQKMIDLSFQVEAFLSGPVGQYLIKRSDEQIESALEEMKRVNPENATQIRALQHLIHVAEDIQYWLADAIQAGHNAAEEFINKEL